MFVEDSNKTKVIGKVKKIPLGDTEAQLNLHYALTLIEASADVARLNM